MIPFYVQIERTIHLELSDEILVPDDVVAKGKSAIRDYINDVVEEFDMDRELVRNNVSFEEA